MSTVKELLQLQKGCFRKKDREILDLREKLEDYERKFQDQKTKLEKLEKKETLRIARIQKKKDERILERKKREARRCKPRCLCCKDRVTSVDSVTSYQTGNTVLLTPDLTCNSEMTIYLLSCRNCDWRYVGSAKRGVRVRSQGHRREVKTNRGALGLHFHKDGACKDSGYSLTLLGQVSDMNMGSLLKLEGFFQRKIPEIFESGNKRLEGQDKRGERGKRGKRG